MKRLAIFLSVLLLIGCETVEQRSVKSARNVHDNLSEFLPADKLRLVHGEIHGVPQYLSAWRISDQIAVNGEQGSVAGPYSLMAWQPEILFGRYAQSYGATDNERWADWKEVGR